MPCTVLHTLITKHKVVSVGSVLLFYSCMYAMGNSANKMSIAFLIDNMTNSEMSCDTEFYESNSSVMPSALKANTVRRCAYCDSFLGTSYHMKQHVARKHLICVYEGCNDGVPSNSRFLTKESLNKHLAEKHPGSIHSCPVTSCGYAKDKRWGLMRHMAMRHEMCFFCKKDNGSFHDGITREGIKNHFLQCHPDKHKLIQLLGYKKRKQ